MTGRRSKSRTLLLVALSAIVLLIAWSQTWSTLSLASGVAGEASVPVSGQTMVPGLSALALTSLALIAALALAGRVFRFVLGAVQLLLGVVICITSGSVVADPITAAAPALISLTGIQDVPAIAALVSNQALTAWPFVSIVAGVVTVLSGVVILSFSASWPQTGRKYAAATQPVNPSSASTAETSSAVDGDSSDARIDAWDDLSRGGDPTS